MTRPTVKGSEPKNAKLKPRQPVSDKAVQVEPKQYSKATAIKAQTLPVASDRLILTNEQDLRREGPLDAALEELTDRVFDLGAWFGKLMGDEPRKTAPPDKGTATKNGYMAGRKEKLAPIGELGKLLGSELDAETVKQKAKPLLQQIGQTFGKDSTVYQSAKSRVEAHAPTPKPDEPNTCKLPQPSPKGKTLIVSANVAEKRFSKEQDADMADASDLKTFVDRTFKGVPYAPDALALQEADPPAAQKVAELMSEMFGYTYQVKASAEGNAIIVNTHTMDVAGAASVITTHAEPDEMTKNSDGVSTGPDRTHLFLPLKEKGKGGKELTLASLHTHSIGFLNDGKEEELAEKWLKQIVDAGGGADAGNLVLAGDYNHAQFKKESDELADFWQMMTGPKMGFHDALLEGAPEEVASGKHRIDFIMSKLGVLKSGSDTEYLEMKDKWKKEGKDLEAMPGYYSDHAFQWTLLDTSK